MCWQKTILPLFVWKKDTFSNTFMLMNHEYVFWGVVVLYLIILLLVMCTYFSVKNGRKYDFHKVCKWYVYCLKLKYSPWTNAMLVQVGPSWILYPWSWKSSLVNTKIVVLEWEILLKLINQILIEICHKQNHVYFSSMTY